VTELPRSSRAQSADGTTIGFHTVGEGEPLIVLGGVMRTAEDYMQLAKLLAGEFSVHVVDRRGRGSSGPLGADYAIEKECEDLLAVQALTHARRLFAHSYGGLVALETELRSPVFDRMVLYEPGVSIDGSIPVAWLPRYRELLGRGDRRGAFAALVQGSGHAPPIVTRLPSSVVAPVMRAVIRKPQWERFDPLLEANLAEHEQVAALDNRFDRYEAITADVLLLGGGRSPYTIGGNLERLRQTLDHCSVGVLGGLAHDAPDGKAPEAVARRAGPFLAR
jgi:pimeloyl-ACP methyl ester carboxylesterase